MGLTIHQEDKIGELFKHVRNGEKRIVLAGSAGVGKTFVTNEIITILKKEFYTYGAIYVTAPTHKALSVLRKKIEIKPHIEFQTIHSALKLKQKRDKLGNKYFARDESSKFNPYNIPYKNGVAVFVDEASMLSTTIMTYIDEHPNLLHIFIGDEKQLNPVGELTSPIFSRGYPTIELTEIVRQGTGSPIIELSRNLSMIWQKEEKLVKDVKRIIEIYEDVTISEEGEKVQSVAVEVDEEVLSGFTYTYDRPKIIERLAEVNGCDDIKYLAWMNTDVDKMNSDVRDRLYGHNEGGFWHKPAKIELGETIVFREPFGEYFTNQELKVEQLDVHMRTVKIPTKDSRFVSVKGVIALQPGSPYDETELQIYLINGLIPVIHELSEYKFKTICNTLKNMCKVMLIQWPVYFNFYEQFADLTYNHAQTVHKSQGSTYRKSIINIKNIMFNKNKEEKQKLLYTGITRTSDLVILYNV